LYRSTRRYTASASHSPGWPGDSAVVLAYYPGSETQARCSDCMGTCATAHAECSAAASALLAGCFFPPACPAAAAAAGAALGACDTASLTCQGICEATKCCPKLCGFPNPLDPGSGCCDHGEHCVDSSDRNARDGCCPSDRAACGGRCCDPGDRCCGSTCCPAGWFCSADGNCTQYVPFGGPGPGKPPRFGGINPRFCRRGETPCGNQCCAAGMECCWNAWSKSMQCMTNCLH
jgi:hypothetical protein